MWRYALSRLATAVPTLLVVIAVAFALVHAAPGGPFDSERAVEPQIEARMAAAYGLDEPVLVQFGRYLANLVRGDFGPSFRYPEQTVSELIAAALPVSFLLGALALIVGVALGTSAGVLAALNQNRWLDRLVMALAMSGISVPVFVIAPVLVLVFAVLLDWLPAGGTQTPGHFVLPVLALATPLVSYIARLTRASMLEVLKSQYIRTARSLGLSRTTLVLRYALKPALIPVVSFLGPAIAALLTGSVVVESVCSLPGLGRLFVQGALNRDYTLVMGLVVLYSTLLLSLNLIVDLLYGLLDPRVRYP